MKPRAAKPFGMPKAVRLRRRSEFLSVQEKGQKFPSECLLAMVLPSATAGGATRVGLTVSSKVGNAVVRNRVRRRLRELFRRQPDSFPRGLDVVLIARSTAAEADLPRLKRAFDRVASDMRRRLSS